MFTPIAGKLNLFNAKYELSVPNRRGMSVSCLSALQQSLYRHLLKAERMLGMRLCVLHNLYFYNHLMEEIRDALDQGNFAEYKEMRLAGFEEGKINSRYSK